MIWECFARRTPYLREIEAGTLKIRTQWELQTHIINGVRPSMDFEENGIKMPDAIKVRAFFYPNSGRRHVLTFVCLSNGDLRRR